MLAERIEVDNIYMVLGRTDMRKSITRLSSIIKCQCKLNPFERSLFLFCGKRADRMKALLWEENGFLLLYRILEETTYQWPRNEAEVQQITLLECHRLLEGLQIKRCKLREPKELYNTEI